MTTEHEKMLITKYDLLFESRLSKVEVTMTSLSSDIKEIKTDIKNDFKFMLYIYSAGFVGLAGLMIKGFGWL